MERRQGSTSLPPAEQKWWSRKTMLIILLLLISSFGYLLWYHFFDTLGPTQPTLSSDPMSSSTSTSTSTFASTSASTPACPPLVCPLSPPPVVCPNPPPTKCPLCPEIPDCPKVISCPPPPPPLPPPPSCEKENHSPSSASFLSSTPVTPTRQCLQERLVLEELGLNSKGFMVVSHKYKFMMCVTPKVASRSWLEYFRWIHMKTDLCTRYRNWQPICRNITRKAGIDIHTLTDRFQRVSEEDYGFSFWEALSLDQQLEIASSRDYFKFSVYRHPWARLESGFRSKYRDICNYSADCMEAHFDMPILKRIEKRVNLDKTSTSYYPWYEAFVDGLALTSPIYINSHFKPQSLLCNHDCITYDALVELSDTKGMDQLTKELKLPDNFTSIAGSGYVWTPQELQLDYQMRHVALAWDYYRADTLRFNFTFDDYFKKSRDYHEDNWRTLTDLTPIGKQHWKAEKVQHRNEELEIEKWRKHYEESEKKTNRKIKR